MARGLSFEFVGEYGGRRGYFFQVPASAKLGRVGPRLQIRLTELADDEERPAAAVANLPRRRSR